VGADGAGRRVPGSGGDAGGIRNVRFNPEIEFANIVAIVPILRRFSAGRRYLPEPRSGVKKRGPSALPNMGAAPYFAPLRAAR